MRILSAPPIALRVGDTAPAPAAVVEFDEDPTGATAELELWTALGVNVITGAAADLSVSAVGAKWEMAILGDWGIEDTEGLDPSLHFARFIIALTGGEIITVPPDDRLRVTVHGAVIPPP